MKASCNPCTVEVGKASTVSAVATSSIGCTVTYAGRPRRARLTNRTAQNTPWTAPMHRRHGAGDGHGDLPAGRQDRERHGQHPGRTAGRQADRLRRRALRLRPLLAAAGSDARARRSGRGAAGRTPIAALEIEGHTCNIGTAEYNLALGERRANSVRDYLRAAASPRAASAPSATAKSGRSTTTRAKRPVVSIAAPRSS